MLIDQLDILFHEVLIEIACTSFNSVVYLPIGIWCSFYIRSMSCLPVLFLKLLFSLCDLSFYFSNGVFQ